jgi:hypothetical protein
VVLSRCVEVPASAAAALARLFADGTRTVVVATRTMVGDARDPTPQDSAAFDIALALGPTARLLGFAAVPIAYFFILLGAIGVYLLLIELAKARFYRTGAAPARRRRTDAERREHRVRRRLARFVHHVPPKRPSASSRR